MNSYPVYLRKEIASLQTLCLLPQTKVISLLQTSIVHQRHEKSNERHPFLKSGLQASNFNSRIISTQIIVIRNYQAPPPLPPVPQLLEFVRHCAIIGNSWYFSCKSEVSFVYTNMWVAKTHLLVEARYRLDPFPTIYKTFGSSFGWGGQKMDFVCLFTA